ncbi:MAG TPA: ATP-binding cassette domain-containing protein [Acholeplasmataceae bacterium]|nr:ATP-binding cassette domain-containing protein [Acholeplasmataceae bacterium]
MSVLVAENLNLTNKNKPSITNFSYNFLDNKIYAILGKSDSGKDVLLDLLSARTKPDEGNVYLDGELLLDNPKMSKRLCYISSKTSFPGHMSVRSICRLMSSYYPKWDNGYAYELLEYFKIKPKTLYFKLEPNEKELVHGIIALACRANITIFLNPLDDVDVKDRYDFYNFMYEHHIRYPRTIIISTDYIDELESIVGKILMLDKGRLIEDFTISEIKDNFRYLSGKTEVLKSLIAGVKIIGYEERNNYLTVCVGKKLTKDETRKYQKYLIKISEVPIQKIFIYLINLREKKGI